ncbi:N-acetylmuramoyl-L-alanine amidase family protein [Flagellimonas flava]|uniref:N-acetylmuramoyl-L-alanine amidase family protein n=1 Tax=Flagellimonas flava TaxID=570519 RepID=UPI003D65708A
MMKSYVTFLFLFLLIQLPIWHIKIHAQEQVKTIRVVLDPGHGGVDSGAVGTNGIFEKDVVLQVAKKVVQLNRELHGNTLEIYLTRYNDTLISLGDRTRLAKVLAPKLYVSLHGNHAPNPKAQGLEVFVWRPFQSAQNPYAKVSESVARSVALKLRDKLGFRDRGVKQANFQVLRDTRALCPSLLLEMGFLSNSEESGYLKTKNGRTGLALAILESIHEYFDHD